MPTKKIPHHDLVIIGGGPIGLACALEARKARIDYIVLEKGCLVNSLYHYPTNMTFFSTSERLEIGKVPFVSINPKPTRAEALEYYRRVAVSHDIQIKLFEEVTAINSKGKRFIVTTSRAVYTANYIIIATGFYDIPFTLNIPGEDLPKLTHYYKDPHFYAMQKVVVIGAQNSAVDAALETWRKGAEVTMVVRQTEIGQRVKYWVRPDIINRIKEGSIKAYYSSTVSAIREHEIDILTPNGMVTIENDWVIAMTGYEPNLDFLEKTGIRLSKETARKPEYDEKTHQTNIPNIYLAGVICGGMDTHSLFIENSRIHAKRIISDVKEKMK
ncbi:YpdA family putative bacillithiol disulfide reductase [Flavihumibacter profundi]|uniref:YpdA family putative bacillithiol disulfide reductase n=1 Tax=Flavihumibacter profundi TaxID=2716883 RepID=UPI001CC43BEF|nr:YpdA family putative bacillithiol disulfide reductase [Flavihumibacter profundi]MBZ5856673.1 YpdA family putative bacillithiol disulfide reductase [Flavihumibacter profundi]